ncbi:hypothetical protein KIPB_008226, partial [Kipferlia bialata]|eukprot:g8226.t1
MSTCASTSQREEWLDMPSEARENVVRHNCILAEGDSLKRRECYTDRQVQDMCDMVYWHKQREAELAADRLINSVLVKVVPEHKAVTE